MGLAFPVEDLVFGGAASANHGGFCKIKRKDGSSLNVAEEAGAHRMDAVPIGVGLAFPVEDLVFGGAEVSRSSCRLQE